MNIWPGNPIRGGGAGNIAPTLQPLTVVNGDAPWAAWSFDATQTGGFGMGTDRSGNGRMLSVPGSALGSPSRRGNGHTSVAWNGVQTTGVDLSLLAQWDAGSLTIAGWLNAGVGAAGVPILEGWWAGYGVSLGQNQCLLGNTSGGKFLYVADPSGGVASVMDFPLTGSWHYVSVRRDVVNNYVRWGVDKTFESASIGPPAAAGPGAALRWGQMPFGGAFNWTAWGALEDWVYWQTILSDDQLLAQRAACVGSWDL